MKLLEMNKGQIGRVMRAANANACRAYDRLFNEKLSNKERAELEAEYFKQVDILRVAWTLYHAMDKHRNALDI